MTPSDFDWAVRAEVYRTFARRGSAPAIAELAAAMETTEHRIHESLRALYEAHEIAPLPEGRGVWMANPFSGVPTEYVVRTPDMTCYANCAWDALGVPAILDSDGWTTAPCAESREPLEFGIRDGRLEGDDVVIHLVTPLRHAWDDIGFT